MTWDGYFLKICNEVASNSKCLSRKIGAILVNDNSIISTGYNGPPRGVGHCSDRYLNDLKLKEKLRELDDTPKWVSAGSTVDSCRSPSFYIGQRVDICPRQILGYKSGEGLEWCIAGHAERNVLINAARHGIVTKGGTLYCNCPIPCTPCLIEIINAGIKEIVVTSMDCYDEMGEWLVKQSEIKIRLFESE